MVGHGVGVAHTDTKGGVTMVRVLRNLRINEVSSVDRAANGDARVVLYKRNDVDDDNNNGDDGDEAFHAALAFLDTPHGAALLARFFPRGVRSVDDIERLGRLLARRMRAAARANSDAEPRDPYQPWTDVIGDDDETEDDDDETEDEEIEKVFPMSVSDRNAELRAIAKRDGGVTGLCRRICKQGAGGISEAELTALITEFAMAQFPEMSEPAAFAKVFLSAGGETLRRAVAIAKGMLTTIEPVQVGGGDSDGDDAARAYGHLERLATETRKRWPGLSASQAFARAAKERPDLLARAVPRR
jgi:hypothetical protein